MKMSFIRKDDSFFQNPPTSQRDEAIPINPNVAQALIDSIRSVDIFYLFINYNTITNYILII